MYSSWVERITCLPQDSILGHPLINIYSKYNETEVLDGEINMTSLAKL